MAVKLTRLTHKTAIQLHLVAESFTICSSRARLPVRKLLNTHSWWLRMVFANSLTSFCIPLIELGHRVPPPQFYIICVCLAKFKRLFCDDMQDCVCVCVCVCVWNFALRLGTRTWRRIGDVDVNVHLFYIYTRRRTVISFTFSPLYLLNTRMGGPHIWSERDEERSPVASSLFTDCTYPNSWLRVKVRRNGSTKMKTWLRPALSTESSVRT